MRPLRPLLAALAAALLAAPAGLAAPPPTVAPGQLTVGVNLPSEGFQVGVVNGTAVLYARGFEIDLAEELADRLELSAAAFFQSPFADLLAPGAKPWDLAVAQVTITRARAANVDFSTAYLRADQGVLLSQYVRSVPRSIAALRRLKLCAQTDTTGAATAQTRVRPTQAVRTIADVPTLLLQLQLGACDAVVYDLPALATLRDRAPRRYGALAGLVRTGERYGVVLPKGSPLKTRVDAAITSMRDDGTLARMQERWLSLKLSQVRALSPAR